MMLISSPFAIEEAEPKTNQNPDSPARRQCRDGKNLENRNRNMPNFEVDISYSRGEGRSRVENFIPIPADRHTVKSNSKTNDI